MNTIIINKESAACNALSLLFRIILFNVFMEAFIYYDYFFELQHFFYQKSYPKAN